MNDRLERLAADLALSDPSQDRLRFAFAHASVDRIAHLLESPEVVDCLRLLGAFVAGDIDRARLTAVAAEAARLANHHPGSKSIDGCGHAAVSATYAVAKAIEGKAIEAASYAAYAAVYAQGGYLAAADREAFQPEFDWQVDRLMALSGSSKDCSPRAAPAAH